MRIVCRGGWAGNTHPMIVFRDDGQDGPDSDTLCIPCRDAMLEKLERRSHVDALPSATAEAHRD